MFHESSKRIVVGIFVALLALTVPAYAVTNIRVSNFGGGHQIWFEAEDFDERNPATDQYYKVVDQAGAFGKAVTRGGAGGIIRWTFDISAADGKGGTWYFWGRVINPNNRSDFMIIEGSPGEPALPSGPPFNRPTDAQGYTNELRVFEDTLGPPWAWLGNNHDEAHTKQLQDGRNTMTIVPREGNNTVFWDVFVWTDSASYVPTDADYQNAKPPALGKAAAPSPANGATDVPREVVLSWKPGKYAPAVNGHKVFFGTVFSDVNNGTVGVAQSASSYTPPQRLDLETTYYWRVDEVNAPPGSAVHKGNVWSFTTEPVGYPISGAKIIATASSTAGVDFGPENTIDGSGLNANDLHSMDVMDMWLSGSEPQGVWIRYEFDAVYSLHQMWVWNGNQVFESLYGFGLKNVAVEYSTNGTDWTALAGVPEFAKASGAAGYAHNTTVDFGGAAAKYVRLTATSNWGGILPQYNLSEVRFFRIPLQAREPNPASGATDVDVDGVLTWRAGREAATHKVYIGADPNALTLTGSVTQAAFDTASLGLALEKSYYWRVDEVNDTRTPATWQGDLWSFSTQKYLVVEDFESYNDIAAGQAGSNLVYTTWLDGYGTTINGSTMGYPTGSSLETTTFHGGAKAVPLIYNNATANFSEVERTLAAQNWTSNGIQTLSLWFRGDTANVPGQLYAKINGVKVLYDGDASNLKGEAWQAWNIDLASAGANLQSVTRLAIGVETKGATGTLLLDDIRLYPLPRQLVTPVQPNPAGLVAHYPLDGNANDVAGAHNGTASAGATYGPGMTGQALALNGSTYVDCGNPTQLNFGTGSWTVSAWVNPVSSTNPMIVFSNGGDESGGIRYVLSVGQSADHTVTLTVDDNVTKVESIGSVVVDDGQWHHIVGIRDGNKLRIYVDGFQDRADVTLPSGYDLSGVSQANAYIGADWNFANKVLQKFYSGAIDEVRIYNYALSQPEIAGLAGKTLPFDKPF